MSKEKLFLVTVRDVTYRQYKVTAQDEDEAEVIVSEGGIDYEVVDGGSWEVTSVAQVEQCAGCGDYIDRTRDGYGRIPGKGYFCVECWADMHVGHNLKKTVWAAELQAKTTTKTYYQWLTDKLDGKDNPA